MRIQTYARTFVGAIALLTLATPAAAQGAKVDFSEATSSFVSSKKRAPTFRRAGARRLPSAITGSKPSAISVATTSRRKG